MTGSPRPLRQLYGRQKGHRLSARQAALMEKCLPRLRVSTDTPPPAELAALFHTRVDEVWLEIGFGGGEHLIAQARANPQAGIVGCEPFVNGVARVLGEIENHKLANLRLFDDDARLFTDWLPDASIDRCFILFPDPWPKKRHAKRRLVAPAFLSVLARILKPGAEFRFATDIPDYVRTALGAVLASGAFRWDAQEPGDWRVRPHDWPATRYEAKALREGRTAYFFSFTRRDTAAPPGTATK